MSGKGRRDGDYTPMTETLPNASILAPAQPAELASSRARAVTQVAAVLLLALCLATMTGWLLRLPGLQIGRAHV